MNNTTIVAVLSLIQLVACASEPRAVQPHSSDRSPGNTSEELSGPIVGDLMAELRMKKVKISRWGEISKNFDKLKIGMPQDEAERMLGKRDVYPTNKTIWQYAPNEFRGGADGPDWNLVIHMKDMKISGFQLLKFVYGPPPG
ncbi:MAG: hypothetical protein ACRCXD_12725 [Luteolibacter sp.]